MTRAICFYLWKLVILEVPEGMDLLFGTDGATLTFLRFQRTRAARNVRDAVMQEQLPVGLINNEPPAT
jgi:hypothetical protein